jgi:AraC family transcriptional regulator of adaptative response/methylated-DNA-[protein]-cysteine methyltransferase
MTIDFQYDVIAEAIDYLVARYADQPDLDALARRAGYDPSHFQKLFKANVGISPKRLVQYMSLRHARDLLTAGATTLEAADAAGLSGNGRLHDLFVAVEAATPGDVKRRGQGLSIVYGFHPTPIGQILVAQTARGVCYLGFLMDQDRAAPLAKMKSWFPAAVYREDAAVTAEAAAHIMRIWRGQGDAARKLTLDLHGTNLQLQVWRALLQIPTGETVTYQHIARQLGRPKAARAIGNAVGANPVSLLVPCHRVIRATGIIDNYGWGSPRKKLLLAMESSVPQDLQA